ncbi:hypothetical protein DHD08_15460 [Arenibacter sp. H213]|nr:hypothetical protein [Arenibacter sp. H213]
MNKKITAFVFILFFCITSLVKAQDPFLGEIRMFGGNFPPRGWAFCHGQLLPINQNQALYSLFGTTYGGDGRTTFAFPELRGRAPIGAKERNGGTNQNLMVYFWGDSSFCTYSKQE